MTNEYSYLGLTWSEFFTSRVDFDLGLSGYFEFLTDILSSGLGDLEHLNKRLIFHQ